MDIDLMQLPPVRRAAVYSTFELSKQVRLACPQQDYLRMQRENNGGLICPIEGVAVSFGRELTDYVLRHHELFSSAVPMPLGNVRPLIPLNIDPPKHGTYRKILDPLFAPRRMDAIEGDVAARANEFIDTFVNDGECNFSEQFAEMYPSAVFLTLMGLPLDLLETMLGLRDGILHPEKFDPKALVDPTARFAVLNATGVKVYDFFNEHLDAREAAPGNDILTHFITAEVDGHTMSRDEILDLCYLFLIAGLDTVSDSLTCMFAFLANNPGHRQQIVDDPSIIPSAVEELLRWESPVPYGVPRVTTEDVELPNGVKLLAGTAVSVSFGGANIDPVEFPDGTDVNFGREANRHIAFGGGVHRCLGSHLARRELRIALQEWHKRIPEYQIKAGHEQLEFPPGLRHVKDLTLSWS